MPTNQPYSLQFLNPATYSSPPMAALRCWTLASPRSLGGSAKHSFDAGSLSALTTGLCHLKQMLRGEAPSYNDDVYALACVAYMKCSQAKNTPTSGARPCKPEKASNPNVSGLKQPSVARVKPPWPYNRRSARRRSTNLLPEFIPNHPPPW